MKNKQYPLVLAIVKPSEYNGRVMRATALTFCRARETPKAYFLEFSPTREKKYPKVTSQNAHGRLSECERGTEKLNVGFSKSYVYDPNSEYVQEIKKALIERNLKDFSDEPSVEVSQEKL